MVNSIAVFCGSKVGNNPMFVAHAKQIGEWMAENKIKLIYGGGSVGLMGAIADSIMQNGGNVIGVIPEVLANWEQGHQSISKLHVVKDMHTRKQMMYQLCDAAIILPGGNGTMDELFEMLTWNTLKIHSKKIVILNTEGYYNFLLLHIDYMQQQGFLHEGWQERIIVKENPEEVFSFFETERNYTKS